MNKDQYFVSVLMGSDSDLEVMKQTVDVLDSFGIPREVRITSAHRTPAATHEYVKEADKRGCAVFIAAAGLAAHLAGTLGGITTKPVIGVPMDGGSLGGIDALLSTVQMPAGIPVACVAIGKAGAKNAGYLAAQIIAGADETIAEKLVKERAENAEKVMQKNDLLKEINQNSS
ncbi:MAG: 5-(carboxyamino)imidazole ribonucleotide mutase [Gammaproteobacteria bacterium]|nr:5-(carboxyamino)imidazole ribonucleotide mutase [Gammaproteobacteria bacterium]